MTDIVERLKAWEPGETPWEVTVALTEDAAAEIVRLREALRFYDCGGECENCYGPVQDTQHCGLTAHMALAAVEKEAGDE